MLPTVGVFLSFSSLTNAERIKLKNNRRLLRQRSRWQLNQLFLASKGRRGEEENISKQAVKIESSLFPLPLS